jgi:anti-anti-sigma factor
MEQGPVFSISQDGGVLIIAPQRNVASLAEAEAEAQMAAVLGLLAPDGPRNVVVDFSAVAYFGSSILEALLRVWNRIRPDGRMALCGLSEVGEEIVRLAKFDTLWDIHPTRRAALAAVRAA